MSKVTRAQKKNAVHHGSGRRVRKAFDRMPDIYRDHVLNDIVDNDLYFFVDEYGNVIRTETPYSNHDME
jgi:hypothetical protein